MTTLLQDVKDGIAVLTLDRPEKLNALNYALIDALEAALDELEADPDIRQGIDAFLSRRKSCRKRL